MSGIKLSHTAKEKYIQSPRAYFLHYHLYLREAKLGSPLFFGTLIEKGIDALFAGKTLEEAQQIFRDNFQRYQVNGQWVSLATSPLVRYSKADLDLDVFTEEELKEIVKKPVNVQSHASLMRKGEMMLAAYHRDILPRIKKVIATQVYFSIKNETGDEITGFADVICEWEDGRIVLFDHKTSAGKYEEDVVTAGDKGKQTAIYFEAFKETYKLDAVGFIVLEKKIRKKEPRARTQVILDIPSPEIIEATYTEFDDVLQNIKMANFPCAAPACDVFGQKCCYAKYCASGGSDMTGLVKVGKSK